MKKLILMVGLPRSGKSTVAPTLGYPVVNRDAIRLALHGKPYLQKAESVVTVMEDNMVEALLLAGHTTVVIDATHMTPKRRDRWKNRFDDCEIQYVFMDTDVVTCVERAKADGREDLIPIIGHMNEQADIDDVMEQPSTLVINGGD